jgi:RNA-directed DNA polymerase
LRSRMKVFFGPVSPKSQSLLVCELLDSVTTEYSPSPQRLSVVLLNSPYFERIAKSLMRKQRKLPVVLSPAKFSPAPAFAKLDAPRLVAAGDLAAWLGISIGQLDWLADSKRQHVLAHDVALRHYHYTFITKASGLPRLLESPKPRLKAIQRRVLHEILDLVPVHAHAHGFVKGRSCLSAANVHVAESCGRS